MSDEAFEKWWFDIIAPEFQGDEDLHRTASEAWFESRHQRDANWKVALGAGFPNYKPELDDIGTLMLAHDAEVEKQVESRVRAELSEPLPCGHPKRCRVQLEPPQLNSLVPCERGPFVCLACSAAREAATRAAEMTKEACIMESINSISIADIVERAVRGDK